MTDADLWGLLSTRRRTHGSDPLLTYISGDERMELSAISTENGAAKVAGALADEFLLDPGARIAMHLPWHWQRSLWIGGIAAIGGGTPRYDDRHTRVGEEGGLCRECGAELASGYQTAQCVVAHERSAVRLFIRIELSIHANSVLIIVSRP